MMALARLWFASWLLLLTSIATNAWADTTLVGSMTLGDGNNAIASDVVMSRSGSVYQPIYPIHFKLTAASTITEVRLKNVTGLSQAAVLVIWSSAGVQLHKSLANVGRSTFQIPGGLALGAGDYQIWVWGQCLQGGVSEFKPNCNNWDEVSYTDIELIGAISDDIALIQRRHIGSTNTNNGYTGTSLFPNIGSSNPVDINFTLAESSSFNQLMLFNLRNPSRTTIELLLIEPSGTSTRINFVSDSGNLVVNNPTLSSRLLAPGQYKLRINEAFRLDISWDDIVIDFISRVSTLPRCEDVFNSAVHPISRDKLDIPPNNGADGSFVRNTGAADDTLAARDYFYSSGSLSFANDSYRLTNNSPSTRMLFNSNFTTYVTGGTLVLNSSNLPERLVIATKANVIIAAGTTVNGFIFAEGSININAGAVVNGAVAAAGQISNNGTVNYRPDALAKTDFNGMCRNTPAPVQQAIQYGQIALGAHTFVTPFSAPPLVFVMPNLDPTNPDADAPSSVKVSNITKTGFIVEQIAPPNRFGGVVKPMSKVDFVAVLPGETTLPDGKKVYAGSITTNASQRGQRGGNWQSIDFSSAGFSEAPAVLLQRASFNNNCWLTASGREPSSNILTSFDVALEVSEVYDGSGAGTCVPGGNSIDNLRAEEIYWLAGTGMGSFMQGGEEIRYEFGFGSNHRAGQSTLNLTQQCRNFNNFKQDYGNPPLFISNKRTRNGGDGGWARRCDISRNQFGVTVDEDQYRDAERTHYQETFSYFSITNIAQTATESLEIVTEVDALTCDAHSIKVRALKDGRLNTLYTGLIQLSTTTNKGRWGVISGGGNLLPNPSQDNGLASYQFVNADNGEVTLSLFHQQAGAVTVRAENIANGTLATANIVFRPYGYRINPVDITGPGAGQYHYANKPFQVTLTAVGKDPSTGSCGVITQYTNTQQVKFWSSYNAPAQVAGTAVEVNQLAIAKNAASAVDQPIVFNAGISVPISINYPDAGRILLSARDDVGLGAPPLGLINEIVQGSQLFTFSPKKLNVRSGSISGYLRDGSGQTSIGNGVASDSGFIRAALPPATLDFVTQRQYDTFDLQVEALIDCSNDPKNHCVSQPLARSFYHDLNLSHTATFPNAPALGIATLSGKNINVEPYRMQAAEQGLAQIQHLAWNEVGRINLAISASQYLSDATAQAATPIAKAEQEVGRFYPAYLKADSMLAQPACLAGGFSYLDQQQIALNLTLSAYAQGVAPIAVTNYDTVKGYPTASDTNQRWQWSAANSAGDLVQSDARTRLLMDPQTYRWQLGRFTLSAEPIGLAKLDPHAVDGPFTQASASLAELQLAITGKDGERLQTDAATQCAQGGAGVCRLGELGDIYYGRLAANSRHGSELTALRVPLVVERFNGTQFEVNSLDSCSALTYQAGNLVPIAQFNWAVDDNKDGNLDRGGNESPIPIANKSTAISMLNATAVAGEMNLSFSAPQAQGRFSYAIDLNPAASTALCWLRFDWDKSGVIANQCGAWNGGLSPCSDVMTNGGTSSRNNDCARGEVEFGLFRGNDRIIYRLEVNN